MDVNFNPRDPSVYGNVPMDGTGGKEAVERAKSEMLGILASGSMRITASGKPQPGAPRTIQDAPEIDGSDFLFGDDAEMNENLERLIAYLKLESDESQAKEMTERLEAMKNDIKATLNQRMGKIKESLEKMDKVHEQNEKARRRSWLFFGLSIVATLVIGAITGGVGAALVGCAIAGAVQFMNQKGIMAKFQKAIVDSAKKSGFAEAMVRTFGKGGTPEQNKEEIEKCANILAVITVAVTITAGSVGGGFAGSAFLNFKGALTGVMANVAKASISAMQMGASSASAYYELESAKTQYSLAMTEADLKTFEKMLHDLKTKTDEMEEDLQAIIEQMMNSVGQLASLMDSKINSQLEISANMARMA